MVDNATTIKRRIEACVIQARANAKKSGGDNATAATDLMCAFVLLSRESGADPERVKDAMWDDAKACVADFWPNKDLVQ